MIKLDPTTLKGRIPIWKALSNLFLDTELQPHDFEYAAERLRESGLSISEIEGILWNELFPALGDNLRITAGQWGYFSDAYLQKRIVGVMNGSEPGMGDYGLISIYATRRIIDEAWRKVRSQLSKQRSS